MNQQDLISNALDFFKGEGYTFLIPGVQLDNPIQLSGGKQALVAAAAGMAFGLLGSLSSGYMDKVDKEVLKKDLQRLYDYCDLAGIHLSSGNVVLRLVMDGDNLSNETIVGRFAMIHERAYDFRKYAMTFLRSVVSDGKLSTYAIVLMAFSSHKRTKDFINGYADKCKHTAFWKKVRTQAWVIDLEDEEITRFPQPLIDLGGARFDKIKAGLFHKRV
jgi:hypothetical protein